MVSCIHLWVPHLSTTWRPARRIQRQHDLRSNWLKRCDAFFCDISDFLQAKRRQRAETQVCKSGGSRRGVRAARWEEPGPWLSEVSLGTVSRSGDVPRRYEHYSHPFTSNDLPFGCPITYTNTNSQCYFVRWHLSNVCYIKTHSAMRIPRLTMIASNVPDLKCSIPLCREWFLLSFCPRWYFVSYWLQFE